ncbi:hypothetical protein SpCBS45565_g04231 [Spizellomyces sp. 'palustris']|nr:hypothetical protein SpCBS45565_g04231 [Spizellomyces sp. 'palustris']
MTNSKIPARYPNLESYLESLPFWSSTDQKANDKVSFLFSRFPAARNTLNAPSYDEKMAFWRGVLTEACGLGLIGEHVLSFDADSLETKFKRRGLVPLGLGTVLADMERTGDLIPLAKYKQRSASPQGWASWAVSSLIVAPLSWGISQITGGREQPKSHSMRGAHVMIPLVKETAEAFLETIRKDAHYASDYVLSMSNFQEQFGRAMEARVGRKTSNVDFELVQVYLQQRGNVLIAEDPTNSEHGIVKVKPLTSSQSSLVITNTDRGIVTMKSTVAMLHKQVDELEERIIDLTRMAQQRLRAGQKERALYHIRQKKLVTQVLEKRLHSVETIEGIIGKIQSAETETEVLTAYDAGSNALKSFIKESGLTVEAVEGTMDRLQDALADQAEIDEAMAVGQNMILKPEEDEDLEEELDALLAEEVEKLPVVNAELAFETAHVPPLAASVTPNATSSSAIPTTTHELDAELDALLLEDERSALGATPSLAKVSQKKASRDQIPEALLA